MPDNKGDVKSPQAYANRTSAQEPGRAAAAMRLISLDEAHERFGVEKTARAVKEALKASMSYAPVGEDDKGVLYVRVEKPVLIL